MLFRSPQAAEPAFGSSGGPGRSGAVEAAGYQQASLTGTHLHVREARGRFDKRVAQSPEQGGSRGAAQQDRLKNGVLIHWGPEKSPSFTSGQGSYLIDATPGSAAGANDSPLRVGETFIDPDAGITLKPLAVGGTAPNEYIDVQVGFGAVDGNRNPVLNAETPAASLAARTNVALRASATDPDAEIMRFSLG